MQALQTPAAVRARGPSAAIVRPTTSLSSRRVAQRQQAPQRDVAVAATAAEIEEVEFRASAAQTAEVQSGLPVLPSDKVKLRVRMRGYNISILADACSQVADIARVTGAKVAGPVFLPTRKKVYCVLRSPHVDKDAREHFEVRTHHRLLDLSSLSAQTVQMLMEWVPPSGLEVETSIV